MRRLRRSTACWCRDILKGHLPQEPTNRLGRLSLASPPAIRLRYDRPMNPRTERFTAGNVKTGNATRAYIDAGFAERGAGQVAHKLLRRAEVQAAVTARMRAAADAADVDTAQIVAAAVSIVERCVDLRMVYDRSGNPIGERMVDAPSAIRALTLLSRYTGGFESRTEVSGPRGGAIAHELGAVIANMTTDELRTALATGEGTEQGAPSS